MSRFTQTKVSTKEKIGTILDKDVAEKLRDRSRKEDRPISDIIQDAVSLYIQVEGGNRDIRMQAALRSCSRPFNLTRAELETLMQEDYFEQ